MDLVQALNPEDTRFWLRLGTAEEVREDAVVDGHFPSACDERRAAGPVELVRRERGRAAEVGDPAGAYGQPLGAQRASEVR